MEKTKIFSEILKLLKMHKGFVLLPHLSCYPPWLPALATLPSWLFLKHTRHIPASEHLHLLFPVPGLLFLILKELRGSLPYLLQVSVQMSPSQRGHS